MMMMMMMMMICVSTPYTFACTCEHFGETYCLPPPSALGSRENIYIYIYMIRVRKVHEVGQRRGTGEKILYFSASLLEP
jgi:hypothetical protein